MSPDFRLHVVGELRVWRRQEAVALPPSKKTRALLAYLAITARPHRRERLCEIFWELPDDPRGSLRWALSKIRALVNGDGAERLVADRERVALALAPNELDLTTIRTALADTPDPGALRWIAAALEEPLLDGLDLPHVPTWQSWLIAERDEVVDLKGAVLEQLLDDASTSDAEALRWARNLHAATPSPRAGGILVRTLRRAGRHAEADEAASTIEGEDKAGAAAAGPPGVTSPPPSGARVHLLHQTIGFCGAADGVRIAYARVGDGPPLVKAANWLNHLELDWGSPIWSKTFQAFAAGRTFIRYDERGNGLSDWDVADISFAAFVRDLETVVDALGLTTFPLLGMSQGCAVSVEYAVRHPERVSALILIGGYAAGWRISASPEERERREAVMTLTRLGWGTSNPAYRHIFSQTFMPDGTPEELAWFDEFQRQTTSPENAVRFQDAFGDIDVRARLAAVRAPTLVLHAREDRRIPLEQGRELAIGIPNARFVALDSRSHILLGHEPAWEILMRETMLFLAEHARL